MPKRKIIRMNTSSLLKPMLEIVKKALKTYFFYGCYGKSKNKIRKLGY